MRKIGNEVGALFFFDARAVALKQSPAAEHYLTIFAASLAGGDSDVESFVATGAKLQLQISQRRITLEKFVAALESSAMRRLQKLVETQLPEHFFASASEPFEECIVYLDDDAMLVQREITTGRFVIDITQPVGRIAGNDCFFIEFIGSQFTLAKLSVTARINARQSYLKVQIVIPGALSKVDCAVHGLIPVCFVPDLHTYGNAD